jgi:hypothetical protein
MDKLSIKGIHDLPTGCGKLRNLDKFDANFFGISDKTANTFDVTNRLLFEETYKAICDSGNSMTFIKFLNKISSKH